MRCSDVVDVIITTRHYVGGTVYPVLTKLALKYGNLIILMPRLFIDSAF